MDTHPTAPRPKVPTSLILPWPKNTVVVTGSGAPTDLRKCYQSFLLSLGSGNSTTFSMTTRGDLNASTIRNLKGMTNLNIIRRLLFWDRYLRPVPVTWSSTRTKMLSKFQGFRISSHFEPCVRSTSPGRLCSRFRSKQVVKNCASKLFSNLLPKPIKQSKILDVVVINFCGPDANVVAFAS